MQTTTKRSDRAINATVLTHSMEQSPSEANRFSASQEISRIL